MTITNDVRAEEETAVLDVIDGVAEAWNNNDGSAFADHFAEDATIITVEGLYTKGREQIRGLLTMLYATVFKGSKVFQKVEDLRIVGDDVAIAVVWNAILLGGLTELPPEENRRAQYVLSKQDGRWVVEAFMNVFITEPKLEGKYDGGSEN